MMCYSLCLENFYLYVKDGRSLQDKNFKIKIKSRNIKQFYFLTIKYNKIGENLKKTHLFLNNRTYGGGNLLNTNKITKNTIKPQNGNIFF